MSLRTILHSAFAYVRSQEANESTAAITLDHVIGDQIKLLKKDAKRIITDPSGDSMGERISRYDRLTALEDDLTKTIDAIKGTNGEVDDLLDLGVIEASTLQDL